MTKLRKAISILLRRRFPKSLDCEAKFEPAEEPRESPEPPGLLHALALAFLCTAAPDRETHEMHENDHVVSCLSCFRVFRGLG